MLGNKNLFILLGFLMLARSFGDDVLFSQRVADFGLIALRELAVANEELLWNYPARLPNTPKGVYNLTGSLSDIKFEGLGRLTNLTTHVTSVIFEHSSFQYGFSIPTARYTGRYNISGSLGSSIQLDSSDVFEVRLGSPVHYYCEVTISVNNAGYISPAERCYSQSVNISAEYATLHFPGFGGNNTSLDRALRRSILEQVFEYAFTSGFRSQTEQALVDVTLSQLHAAFEKTRLFDIIYGNQTSETVPTHGLSDVNRVTRIKLPAVSDAMNERISKFVVDTLASLSANAPDPLTLENTIWNILRSGELFFPISGQLNEFKISGISRRSNIICRSRTGAKSQIFNIEYLLNNVTLTGHYYITGCVTGDPNLCIQEANNFTITAQGARFSVEITYENVDGHFVSGMSYLPEFKFTGTDFSGEFPGLLDSLEIGDDVRNAAIRSVAETIIFCQPGMVACSNSYIAHKLSVLTQSELRIRFAEVPIVDILKRPYF